MPRPFLKQHVDAGRLGRYVMRSPGKRIGGNVLAWSKDDLTAMMMGGQNMDAPRFLHMTISMPPGLRLDTSRWRAVFQIAFRHIGLRIQSLPHFIWRHSDTQLDHADAMITLRDFVGRDIMLSGEGAACDRADLEISEYLNLPRPHVPHYGRWPRPGLFHRKKPVAASRELTHAYAVMDECLREQRPQSLDEFVKYLAPRLPDFDVGTRRNTRGSAELELRLPNGALIGAGAISKDLAPNALESRFRLFRHVSGLRSRMSDLLLILGSAEIYDDWLKKRKAQHVCGKVKAGGALARLQENRGLPPRQDDQDRRGRGTSSGDAPDARNRGWREGGPGREDLPRDRGCQDAAIGNGSEVGRDPSPTTGHGGGTEPSGRTVGQLIGLAAEQARAMGAGWHPRVSADGRVGILGPDSEWFSTEATARDTEDHDEPAGPQF